MKDAYLNPEWFSNHEFNLLSIEGRMFFIAMGSIVNDFELVYYSSVLFHCILGGFKKSKDDLLQELSDFGMIAIYEVGNQKDKLIIRKTIH